MLLAAGCASLLLTGCGPRRVRVDFAKYENSYAVTSNREELLNLARLEKHDPTYFFKLGQISSSYRMEASLTGSGSFVPQGTVPGGGIATGGGTPGLIYENDPSFTLIPVDNDTNANILLKPVDSTVFYSLYLQGWRLDQLFRLTVNRIELTVPVPPDPKDPDHKIGCKVEVIRNLPPPSFDGKDKYANDGFSLASYITFLRVSAVIYALQKHGLLLLRGTNSFEPLDRSSYIPNISNDAGGGQKTPTGGTDTHTASSSGPAAKDFDDAAAKNQVWELQGADDKNTGGNWFLGANTIEPQFQLTSRTEQTGTDVGYAQEPKNNYGQNIAKIKEQLLEDFRQKSNGMTELLGNNAGEGPDLTEILEILYNGFSIEESSSEQQSEKDLCGPGSANKNRIAAHLVLRSLIGLMAAAAQEQESFDQLEQINPDAPMSEIQQIVEDTYKGAYLATTEPSGDEIGKISQELPQKVLANDALINLKSGFPGKAGPTFRDFVPEIEQLPVLKLIARNGDPPLPRRDVAQLTGLGLALKYRNRDYFISDPDASASDKPGASNAASIANTSPFVQDNQYWNRDMFRLINELTSQVSVDISKFPLPEVLQLRTE